MAKRLAAALYALTAFATLNVGLASFNSVSAILSPIDNRWLLPTYAFIHFSAPTIFLFASISAICSTDKTTTSRWITTSVVFVVLMLVFIHHRPGWKLFSEAAGAIISVVFILGSLARHASTIAGIGTITYALVQGQELILRLQFYWSFGGSYQHILATLTSPILVTASLSVAICLRSETEQPIPRS